MSVCSIYCMCRYLCRRIIPNLLTCFNRLNSYIRIELIELKRKRFSLFMSIEMLFGVPQIMLFGVPLFGVCEVPSCRIMDILLLCGGNPFL